MKALGDRAKKIILVALSAALGFAGGFVTKELWEQNNSAHARAQNVIVEKVADSGPANLNRLIAPNLWDVYVDPLITPIRWAIKPLALVPLVSFPAEIPKIQTIDGSKELRIIAQVPGMTDKDVKVEASESSVIIKGEKKQETKDKEHFETMSELFQQSVHLPCKVDADKVQASVKDGVLTVTLPKRQ
ncbi:hypothetical protein Lal_00015687 [Lupinus albus]|nr:hypothetical protein Lal_00015687 [Lupinus albus]